MGGPEVRVTREAWESGMGGGHEQGIGLLGEKPGEGMACPGVKGSIGFIGFIVKPQRELENLLKN